MPALLRELLGAEEASIPEVLSRRVDSTPEATFLHWEGATCTYAEAWKAAKAMAEFLQARGVTAGDRVASYLTNQPACLWAWFGTNLIGATYVPLNREHKGPLLADMVQRCGARVVITERDGLGEFLHGNGRTGIHPVVVDGEDSTTADEEGWSRYAPSASPAPQLNMPRPGALAEVMYTSGTTGRSKAVMLPHNMFARGPAHFAAAAGMTSRDCFHGWLPLFHIFGQLHMTMATILAGGSIALVPRFSVSRFWSEVDEAGATIFGGLPVVLRLLWSQPRNPADSKNSLRLGIVGKPPAELRPAFEERFGVKLIDSYGMTEMEPVTLPAVDQELPLGSCGKQAPDFTIAVVDDEGGELAAAGGVGELLVRPRRRDVMFHGYEGDPAATVKAWKDLWFHTGDLARINDDGYVYIIDRRKYAIRRRGENISSEELEEIVGQHPAVRECAAVGVPSPLGEDDVKVAVAPEPGQVIEPQALREWCEDQMARFMVPRWIAVHPELPHLAVGKVDKDALRATTDDAWDAEAATR